MGDANGPTPVPRACSKSLVQSQSQDCDHPKTPKAATNAVQAVQIVNQGEQG